MRKRTPSPKAAMEKAIEFFGTQVALGAAVGIRQSSISEALRKGRPSVDLAMRIEKATNGQVPRTLLRPDIWASDGECSR